MHCLLIALVAFSAISFAQSTRIAVIAHRGEHIRNPENSLSGIRAAIDLGADFVELDVRTTIDGHLVLMHDPTVDRTTNGTGVVAEMYFDHVRALSLGKDRVPTLEEALEVARGKIGVYVDSKSLTPEALVRALDEQEMRSNVVVFGSVAFLKAVSSLRPDIKIMPEAQNPENVRSVAATLRSRTFAFDRNDFNDETLAAAKAVATDIFVDRLGPNDNSDSWQDAIRRGATGIQTDKPGELLHFLRVRNLHAAVISLQ
jgi:glycerophosphoryl diester phosphodiesterase